MADERISSAKPAAAPAAGPNGKPASQPAPGAKPKEKKPREPRDLYREIAETVVFVVVLVLMLKTFVAEAFVIPTGSMAETLYGYHKMVTCERCEYVFPLNCSNEVDPQRGVKRDALSYRCPNCQFAKSWPTVADAPPWSSGDRVLVAKFLFDNDHLFRPHRHQVFVFKFPREPQIGSTAWNYIKRCEGEPTETIAIFNGNLYVTKSLMYPEPQGDPKDFWMPEYCHMNDPNAVDFFKESMVRREAGNPMQGDFEMVLKPPHVMLAMRRIVNDNDHQDANLPAKFRRWTFEENSHWSGDDAKSPKLFTFAGGADDGEKWLTYGHRLREDSHRHDLDKPDEFQRDPRQLISDQMGYNSGDGDSGSHWVGDLMLDCHVKVTNPQGELVFELAKGIDRFQARFDLGKGDCTLVRLTGKLGNDPSRTVLGTKPCKLKQAGNYHVRFANFDERLTVWVDRQLPFGDGLIYPSSTEHGSVAANDLVPARIGGMKCGFEISHLQLWRNSYYTTSTDLPIPGVLIEQKNGPAIPLLTIYVQKGHYLALGDNSSQSSDSRYWGLVPERLLLGRALAVYFPFWPFSDPTRLGFIH